jgi:hypothetical protein
MNPTMTTPLLAQKAAAASFLAHRQHLFQLFPLLNSMVQHPVARVLQKFINLHRTQLQSYLFIYFILFLISTTRHVSAHL